MEPVFQPVSQQQGFNKFFKQDTLTKITEEKRRSVKRSQGYYSSLHYAVFGQNVEDVKSLLSQGDDVDGYIYTIAARESARLNKSMTTYEAWNTVESPLCFAMLDILINGYNKANLEIALILAYLDGSVFSNFAVEQQKQLGGLYHWDVMNSFETITARNMLPALHSFCGFRSNEDTNFDKIVSSISQKGNQISTGDVINAITTYNTCNSLETVGDVTYYRHILYGLPGGNQNVAYIPVTLLMTVPTILAEAEHIKNRRQILQQQQQQQQQQLAREQQLQREGCIIQ